MAFSRATALSERPDDAALTRDMVGIGMNFAAQANPSAPFEETLVHASELGMKEHDLRVLAVLTTWLDVHHGAHQRRSASALRVRARIQSSARVLGRYRTLALEGPTLRPAREAPRRSARRSPPSRDRLPDRASR
jgi:hypothetical protein